MDNSHEISLGLFIFVSVILVIMAGAWYLLSDSDEIDDVEDENDGW